MPRAVRKWDLCTGHGCFPPRINDQASPNVMINSPGGMGRGSHRLTDHWVVHCLVGNTKIKLHAGPAVRIKDLVDAFSGSTVYSCTEQGIQVAGNVVNAFISTYATKLVTIWISAEDFFTCSLDHLVMMENGSYIEAQFLTAGSTLMSVVPGIRVVAVETFILSEPVPLYDLTIQNVENTHNFALECGVFVHNCCVGCHDSNACQGSPNVIVNHLRKCRVGDAVCCGSRMAQGSPNVFVNDPH